MLAICKNGQNGPQMALAKPLRKKSMPGLCNSYNKWMLTVVQKKKSYVENLRFGEIIWFQYYKKIAQRSSCKSWHASGFCSHCSNVYRKTTLPGNIRKIKPACAAIILKIIGRRLPGNQGAFTMLNMTNIFGRWQAVCGGCSCEFWHASAYPTKCSETS